MSDNPWVARWSGTEGTRANDRRPPYERDRARLIHTSAFRRLQGKTQVLGLSEGDFHRTRLTHTMEVAQIARGIVLQLSTIPGDPKKIKDILPPLELMESIAFAHDLGHPPFGHSGEVALNYMMRDKGGFEGNGQSLRILTRLAPSYPGFGLDLTRRTLLGILKYPRPYSEVRRLELPPAPASFAQVTYEEWKPPKCYLGTEADVVEWVLRPLSEKDKAGFLGLAATRSPLKHGKTANRSLDCAIMELGDDIAYGVHDFEDGVALGFIHRDQWADALASLDRAWAKEVGLDDEEHLTTELFAPSRQGGNRKRAIGAIVHAMIVSVDVEELDQFDCPLLRVRPILAPPARRFLQALETIVHEHVIRMQTVQTLEYRGRVMVMQLFQALSSNPDRLLSATDKRRLSDPGADADRVVCDYIAGMTDVYATRMYERLFVPRQGTVFEHL